MTTSYRIFDVTLKDKIVVSPSIVRCVFSGPEVNRMKLEAPDQRIKLLFPAASGAVHALKNSEEWYRDYMSIPAADRPVMRTYTLRALRAELHEMDVEFALHGISGPASAWATRATPGDMLQIVAPNADHNGDSGGYEWIMPDQVEQALVIADETALPAAMGILEQLAQLTHPPRVQALFEVPLTGDCVGVTQFPFAQVHWLPRGSQHARGSLLLETVRDKVTIPACARSPAQSLTEHSLGGDLLWERAEGANTFYAWVAADSSSVKTLRRYLIGECELDRSAVNFMAYWC
ncbi:siderophore-interacting protein [Pantoea sp. B65]|uniref:siderophore-interacting protein n=1 Tax=Pantoea sp. B65 TaxID=2813359 RepID=UPI0039B4B712